MPDYRLVAGDTGCLLRVSCTNDDDGSVIDLTGAAVTLKWKDSAGMVVSRTMTAVAPATQGIAEYLFAASELIAPAMRFEIQISLSGRIVRSLDLIDLPVRTPLA